MSAGFWSEKKRAFVPPSQIAPLRAAAAARRAETHCARGHLLVVCRTQRRCLRCQADASTRYRAKKRREREALCARAFPHTIQPESP